jgi:hypothetical protein
LLSFSGLVDVIRNYYLENPNATPLLYLIDKIN